MSTKEFDEILELVWDAPEANAERSYAVIRDEDGYLFGCIRKALPQCGTEDELIARLAKQYSDYPYVYIVYNGQHEQFGQLSQRAFDCAHAAARELQGNDCLNDASWKIGYLDLPAAMRVAVKEYREYAEYMSA